MRVVLSISPTKKVGSFFKSTTQRFSFLFTVDTDLVCTCTLKDRSSFSFVYLLTYVIIPFTIPLCLNTLGYFTPESTSPEIWFGTFDSSTLDGPLSHLFLKGSYPLSFTRVSVFLVLAATFCRSLLWLSTLLNLSVVYLILPGTSGVAVNI